MVLFSIGLISDVFYRCIDNPQSHESRCPYCTPFLRPFVHRDLQVNRLLDYIIWHCLQSVIPFYEDLSTSTIGKKNAPYLVGKPRYSHIIPLIRLVATFYRSAVPLWVHSPLASRVLIFGPNRVNSKLKRKVFSLIFTVTSIPEQKWFETGL